MVTFRFVCFLLCLSSWLSPILCEEWFEESIWIKRLATGQINTRMEFIIQRELENVHHTRLFPRTLTEILTAHEVQELRFTLTQGHWRLRSWGDPFPGEMAPTGAQLVAWFLANVTDDRDTVDANWRGLSNRLSGMTCASLNFLDETTSIEPEFAYRPIGTFMKGNVKPSQKKAFYEENEKSVHVRVGALPREFICTENLTPWTKLLPCGVTRGLASLLRAKLVFNTHYHSAGLQYTQSKTDATLKLTLSLVFDNPPYAGNNDNFVKNVFGSMAIFPCHVARRTSLYIQEGKDWKPISPEQLNSLKLKDLPDNKGKGFNLVFTPVKNMGGYGQEYGKLVVEMANHLQDKFLSVLYVEVLPWYIRPYLHTMTTEVTKDGQILPVPQGEYFHYTAGRDRKRLHKLEMDIQIPPASKVTLSFMVEKGHLKWDEYPPDANHGFYLEAAHFEVNLTTSENIVQTRNYYSRVLLINLSTPDFSMPYNVICLTCTVVALAFGPLHNITTKTLQLKTTISKSEKLKIFWSKIWKKKECNQKFSDEVKDSEKGSEEIPTSSSDDASSNENED